MKLLCWRNSIIL